MSIESERKGEAKRGRREHHEIDVHSRLVSGREVESHVQAIIGMNSPTMIWIV